jgi:S-adenosylmethionine:tRNA ribosyltransferase-isomerase
METCLFDYELPEERIASHPLPDRDAARLLVLERNRARHAAFRDFPDLVPEGSLVVLNDTRVIKARIVGARANTFGKVEILLTRRVGEAGATETWLALGHASKPLRPGARIESGPLAVEILGREDGGLFRVRVSAPPGSSVADALDTHGHVPLPPYMRRADEPEDAERYQTVFAEKRGSVAAPTAGLHLSQGTLERLRARNVEIAFLTLHVGLGTFRPVSAPDLDEHPMHTEWFEVNDHAARAVRSARERRKPVVAVGTTVVRALESARDPDRPGLVRAVSGETALLIQPGYAFGVVDALLTNFHQPKSTLLALVSAFAGRERVLAAYEEALGSGYRFLSYGDAMWIPERLA